MTTRAPYPHEPPPQGPGPHGAGPRRPRRRGTPLPLALAAFAVLEIWLLVLLTEAAGGLTVLAVLAGGFLLGSVLMKRAGRRAWQELAESLQRAQRPGAEPPTERRSTGGGNALAMLGGLLLMVPGLLSDVLGLLCVFPPTARLLRRSLRRYAERRAFPAGGLGDAYQQARSTQERYRMWRPDGKVVEGEVIRDEEPPSGGDQPPSGR
ncbi:FxsA family protein [Streptomyces sp. AJS327]|uniref:FxsA family membrane protein n=1 Tax=Streptomyces sp. AJS327 TaxID=2545265 RepID=UPI0015DF3624|nr:FxsA family membrane protein [Streptomyces sp. AJS327]MBA0051023.1 FxsA family protein [Streptomyces sp. AJS327]